MGWNEMEWGKWKRTFATPKFSMAGILWPAVRDHDINGARFFKV